MLQQAMKKTPIAASSTDLQCRIRPMMPLGNPHYIILLPLDEALALIGKHQCLEAIDSGQFF
jgi:hypothetical protein